MTLRLVLYRVSNDFCKWHEKENVFKLTRNRIAPRERISRVSLVARTYRAVIVDLTAGVLSAGSGTGVRTLLVKASLVLGTFRTDNAFGPAGGRRADVGR